MLLGENTMICSCCLGKQEVRGFLGPKRCGQCGGVGFDVIGKKTAEALGLAARAQGDYRKKVF